MWNPSFDVTPSSLITGIVTELGVATATIESHGVIDLTTFLRSQSSVPEAKFDGAVNPSNIPPSFIRLDETKIGDYVLANTKLRNILEVTNTTTSADLEIQEVGDGNINFVYIIHARATGKKIVVKQALPYVRCIGESWPLPLSRASFEYLALVEEKKYCPEHVPEVYCFDRVNATIGKLVSPLHLAQSPSVSLSSFISPSVSLSSFIVIVICGLWWLFRLLLVG